MAITTWRQGDTSSTIDDALRDGLRIIGQIVTEIADRHGVPRDWLKQIGRLLEPPQS